LPKRNLFVLLLLLAVAAAAWLARERNADGRRLGELLSTIEASYLEPMDRGSLFDAAVAGVFSRLDEHSTFVAGDRRDELEALLDQEFGGVGLELVEVGEPREISVLSPVVGSPAWHAGIAPGDRIRAVDGASTRQLTLDETFRRLRGRPGSAVVVAVEPAASSAAEPGGPAASVRDVSLVREIVRTESVLGDRRGPDGSWEWIAEGETPAWAFVRIVSFGERTPDELRRALDAIASRSAAGPRPTALVIDLRGNAGGLLSAAVDVCDLFLDDGVIVSTRGRRDGSDAGDDAVVDVRRAAPGAVLADLPMAVLVDGLTASAAEVVAACLQDHGRAIVVGSRTFGKGTVQSILPLSDGSGLVKLTTAEYLRPSRRNIHRRSDDDGRDDWGVSPDPGCGLTPTRRQLEALESWRRLRDIVPPKGRAGDATLPDSWASRPRQADPVLAKALESLRTDGSP
jgi:carboxyl-terminal processing protease